MLSAIGRAVTIIALCLSLGMHWFALQSVAWTTMLVANARKVSLREAVTRTFDGAHPCDLCHAVAARKNPEKRSEVVPKISKIDLICTGRTRKWLPAFVGYEFPGFTFLILERALAPPAPPPRALFS